MALEDWFYRYKERGVVEKDGQKYKKYVKVPVFRTKHRNALVAAVLVVVGTAAVFVVVRRFAERTPPPRESLE